MVSQPYTVLMWYVRLRQDELVQALRSDGRRQAAQRMLRMKRDGQMMLSAPEGGFESE